MLRNCFRFDIGKRFSIAALVALAMLLYFRLAGFPLQSGSHFMTMIEVRNGKVSYPRAIIFGTVAERSSIMEHFQKDRGVVRFQTLVFKSEPESGRVMVSSFGANKISYLWIYVELADAPAKEVKRAQHVLEECLRYVWRSEKVTGMPLTQYGKENLFHLAFEEAFEKIPLTKGQKALLKLQFLGIPFRTVVVPVGARLNHGMLMVKTKLLFVSSEYAKPAQ